jgi:DNA ligase-1
MSLKPMLAAASDGKNIRFPCLASPKIDGVRALIIGGEVLSRRFKLIPNRHVQELFGKEKLNGLDGELVVGSPTHPLCITNTTSGVMSQEGKPDVTLYVFDDFTELTRPYETRVKWAKRKAKGKGVVFLAHRWIYSAEELEAYEAECLAQGYEGVMVRAPEGPYKCGRSTKREGWLLKIKRFVSSEAYITGFKEQQANTNEAKRNAVGAMERSSHKAGKKGKGVLGAVLGTDIKSGRPVDCGTGFSDKERAELWGIRNKLLMDAAVFVYKFFPHGNKDRPRHAVWGGLRSKLDMGTPTKADSKKAAAKMAGKK